MERHNKLVYFCVQTMLYMLFGGSRDTFSLPLCVKGWLRFVTVAIPGLFSLNG